MLSHDIENKALFDTLKKHKESGYRVLMDLTAVDYVTHTKILYLLHNPDTFERMFITTTVQRGESIPSVTTLWEGANWYERELWDMFGIHITDHPDLTRILMPDDWRGHPLQKDYALTEEPVEFKHNVHPKVPSEIIPHVR